jgi:hypothetical protein
MKNITQKSHVWGAVGAHRFFVFNDNLDRYRVSLHPLN